MNFGWRNNMQSSEQINELATALSKAQTEMSNPGFDSKNPHFGNKFASLAAVRNAVVPPLAKNGIAIVQDICNVEGGISCLTRLVHLSGQWMEFGPLVMPFAKADAQGFGSAATYCKRYHLMAINVVAGDTDDDAEAAVKSNGEIHSPKGDLGKNVPTDRAREVAMEMLAIIDKPAADGDHDEKLKALTALDYHDRVLNRDEDLYVAVGEQLSASKRNVWKALISLARNAQKADRAIDNAGRKF
jgi:hypothetical protein